MTALIVIGIIVAYFVIGIVVGRVIFVSVLGNNARSFQSAYNGRQNTRAYQLASKWAWWSILIWIVLGPMYWITKETSHEKEVRQLHEIKESEKKLNDLTKWLEQSPP